MPNQYVEVQYSFVWDLYGEKEGGHFLKLHPQKFRNFDVHFWNIKPSSSFQPVCKDRRGFYRILAIHNLFFTSRHVSKHR